MNRMPIRILTVEDDARIRTALRLALENEGWEVQEANSGEEALVSFALKPADLVLVDIMLPRHRRVRRLPGDKERQRRSHNHAHRQV